MTTTTQSQSNLKGIRYRPELGTWEARISINKISYPKTFKTLDAAQAWLQGMRNQKSSNCFLTCDDLFPKWLVSLKNDTSIKFSTYKKYEDDSRLHIFPYFGKMKIQDISDSVLLKFAVHLKERNHSGKFLSASTIKNLVGTLSNFFEYACLREHLLLNPAKSPAFIQNMKRLLKDRKKAQNHITEKSRTSDELKKLIQASYDSSFEIGLAVEFLATTGTRLGELAALTYGDLHQTTDQTTGNTSWFCMINKTRFFADKSVQQGAKSGSDGLVPISIPIIQKLKLWKEMAMQYGYDCSPQDVIFPKVAKNQMYFSRLIGKISIRIGIRRTTAHCLRHSYVTFLATHGHDLQDVQKAARHKTVTMTRNYFWSDNLSMDRIAKTMEQLSIPILKVG